MGKKIMVTLLCLLLCLPGMGFASTGIQSGTSGAQVTDNSIPGTMSKDLLGLGLPDLLAPAQPVVNPVTDKDTKVTGMAELGSKVTVKANGAVIGTATASILLGSYSVSLPAPQPAGKELSVTATDTAGNTSKATVVVVKDTTAPAQPVVNPVTDKDTTVTGTAEAGSTVTVKSFLIALGTATAGADGKFIVTISKAQASGTQLNVTATDAAGNTSEAAVVTVQDGKAPAQPVVNPVTDKDTTVTGTAEAGSKVVVKANGTVLGAANASANGQFTVLLSAAQKGGTELSITATDANNNTSEAAVVVVKDTTAPAKPVVSPVTDKDTTVTGTAEAKSNVAVKASSAVLGTATADANGQFTVQLPAAQAAGTVLSVTATDAAGNTSEAATVTVQQGRLSGWVSKDGKKYYYDPTTSELKKGWFTVEGTRYYADASGVVQTGLEQIGTDWYYFDANGAMQTGWMVGGSKYYYFKSNGAMQFGWLKSGSTWYYFDNSGAMATGWLKSGNTWYYFKSNGAMQTGWLKSGSTWYYFKSSGAMQTGWLKLGNTWYYFKSSGAMATGSVTISGKKYNFSSSGALN